MKKTIHIRPNSITPLKAHQMASRTVRVEHGHLNVEIGEHVYILTDGQEIHIPQGVPFAYANLSPNLTELIEDDATEDEKIALYADETGQTYIENPGPSTQISFSLYQSLADMRIATGQKVAA